MCTAHFSTEMPCSSFDTNTLDPRPAVAWRFPSRSEQSNRSALPHTRGCHGGHQQLQGLAGIAERTQPGQDVCHVLHLVAAVHAAAVGGEPRRQLGTVVAVAVLVVDRPCREGGQALGALDADDV